MTVFIDVSVQASPPHPTPISLSSLQLHHLMDLGLHSSQPSETLSRKLGFHEGTSGLERVPSGDVKGVHPKNDTISGSVPRVLMESRVKF